MTHILITDLRKSVQVFDCKGLEFNSFASIAPNLCKYDRHGPDDGVCDAIRSSSKVRKMINWLIGAQRRSITQNHEQNHTPAPEYRAQAKYELCPSLREDQPQFD